MDSFILSVQFPNDLDRLVRGTVVYEDDFIIVFCLADVFNNPLMQFLKAGGLIVNRDYEAD